MGHMERVNKKQLGDRIRELRTAAGHTQDDLAELLEQKRQVVSYYENGTRMPNIEQIMTIAKEYNTTTDYLLGLTDVATTDKDIQFVCDYIGLNEKSIKFLYTSHNLAQDSEFADFINLLLKEFDLKTIFNYMFELKELKHLSNIDIETASEDDGNTYTINEYRLSKYELSEAFSTFLHREKELDEYVKNYLHYIYFGELLTNEQ